MTKFRSKITLPCSRDIPFDKLVLSQANVRHVKAGVEIEELAADIARRGLLQGLSVRAIVDADGEPTGMFEVPAGGRRFRALELLVRQKRMIKTAPVPCVLRETGLAEEDSLAENVQRAALHPLDQFRAFLALRKKGQSEEEIAANFFVSVGVVKQRLRLATVSPRLLDAYAEDTMSLDQLMAFTVSGDHARQEQVFDRLSSAYDKQPYLIRRMLTEGAVRASDKRAQFVGLDAYQKAGGVVLHDLFLADDGGWLQDAALLDAMVADKLKAAATEIVAQGWLWVEVSPDFPYGHTFGLRALVGEPTAPSSEEDAARTALQAERDGLEAAHSEADELPAHIDERLGQIEEALDALALRPTMFLEEDVARAGTFVSLAADGRLRIEQGFVRPQDEPPVEPQGSGEADTIERQTDRSSDCSQSVSHVSTATQEAPETEDEGDGFAPLSDRLLTELTANRTLALRHAIGEQPEIAMVAALHVLALRTFYQGANDSCLELRIDNIGFSAQAPHLGDSTPARELDERHRSWAAALPREPAQLWDVLLQWDSETRQALFAHVVALSINAVHVSWQRRPRALAHAACLAEAVDLDMAAAGWTPTVDTYIGRVTKARILQAVTEACGERAAERIASMKKPEMAVAAEDLLAGSGWLPEPLRTKAYAVAALEQSERATIEHDAPVGSDDEIIIGEAAE